MIPLSIWARMVSGLIWIPQSTTHQTIRSNAVLETDLKSAEIDERACNAMRPSREIAVGIESRNHSVVVIGPVHIVLDVFLARIDHLDRAVHLARDLEGAHGAVE